MIDAPQTEQAERAAQTAQEESTAQAAELDEFELNFRKDMTVEVLSLENRLVFVGKVESYRNGAMVIREAKGNELPMALYNKEIKLRFFRERGNLVLNGKVCGSTKLIWKVDRLSKMFTKEQRAFFRQGISPDTGGRCSRRAYQGKMGTRPAPCRVLDISAGGILISSQEEYEVNNRLAITAVYLTKTEEPFTFNCQVRRVCEPDSHGFRRYGCKFESLTPKEQDRLLRAIFAVQREEIRNQKERDGM